MKKGRKEKTKFSKILSNDQIITACCIELWVQEITVNRKLITIDLTHKLSMISVVYSKLKLIESVWCTNVQLVTNWLVSGLVD